MLRPTPGDPWGVEQHHWNTGAEENQQLNPGGPSNRQKSSGPNQLMISYLGRVKQSYYYTHVLYTIPNPNYTLPKPYPFIITYPIHHPTLGTKTGRVSSKATINTILPWTPTYPYPSPTKNELWLSNLSIRHCLKLISILCFS